MAKVGISILSIIYYKWHLGYISKDSKSQKHFCSFKQKMAGNYLDRLYIKVFLKIRCAM